MENDYENMENDYENMDGSQLWDILVGSQTVQEFMDYNPNQTVEEAVEEYVCNANFRCMFPGDWTEQPEDTIEYMRMRFIEFINYML